MIDPADQRDYDRDSIDIWLILASLVSVSLSGWIIFILLGIIE